MFHNDLFPFLTNSIFSLLLYWIEQRMVTHSFHIKMPIDRCRRQAAILKCQIQKLHTSCYNQQFLFSEDYQGKRVPTVQLQQLLHTQLQQANQQKHRWIQMFTNTNNCRKRSKQLPLSLPFVVGTVIVTSTTYGKSKPFYNNNISSRKSQTFKM